MEEAKKYVMDVVIKKVGKDNELTVEDNSNLLDRSNLLHHKSAKVEAVVKQFGKDNELTVGNNPNLLDRSNSLHHKSAKVDTKANNVKTATGAGCHCVIC